MYHISIVIYYYIVFICIFDWSNLTIFIIYIMGF